MELYFVYVHVRACGWVCVRVFMWFISPLNRIGNLSTLKFLSARESLFPFLPIIYFRKILSNRTWCIRSTLVFSHDVIIKLYRHLRRFRTMISKTYRIFKLCLSSSINQLAEHDRKRLNVVLHCQTNFLPHSFYRSIWNMKLRHGKWHQKRRFPLIFINPNQFKHNTFYRLRFIEILIWKTKYCTFFCSMLGG